MHLYVNFDLQEDKIEEVPQTEKHLKQRHPKDYDIFLAKKDEKMQKHHAKLQRQDRRRHERDERQTDEGKQRRVDEMTKRVMADDAKSTISITSGTAKIIWQYFQELPNSENIKCIKCHRYVVNFVVIFMDFLFICEKIFANFKTYLFIFQGDTKVQK